MALLTRDWFGEGGLIYVTSTELRFRSREEGRQIISELVNEGTLHPDEAQPLYQEVDGPSGSERAKAWLAQRSPFARVIRALTSPGPRRPLPPR